MKTYTRRWVKCRICRLMLPNESALRRHKLLHLVFCGICKKSISSKLYLPHHLRTVHRIGATIDNDKPLQGKPSEPDAVVERSTTSTTRHRVKCTICKRLLPNEPALRRHKVQHRVACATCGRSFACRNGLRRHMRTKHRIGDAAIDSDIPLLGKPSDEVVKRFTASTTRKEGVTIDNDKPLQGKPSKSDEVVERSTTSTTRHAVECAICKKLLPNQAALSRHKLQHRVAGVTFGRSLSSRHHLRRHMRAKHRIGDAALHNDKPLQGKPSGEVVKRFTASTTRKEGVTIENDKPLQGKPSKPDEVVERSTTSTTRVGNWLTSSVPDEDSEATIPYTELEEKPVESCTLHGVSQNHKETIEPILTAKPDEALAVKLEVLAEGKEPHSELATTFSDQRDYLQNVNRSTTSNILNLSVKLEPEDLDEKAIYPPLDGPTIVSAANEDASVVVKVEVTSNEIGDGERLTEPAQGNHTKRKSGVTTDDADTLTAVEMQEYLQAQKELYPFPRNEKEWNYLWGKFSNTCPYCPSKVVHSRLKRMVSTIWRAHIEQHMMHSKKREEAQAFADLWSKHTPSCLYCARDFSSKLGWSSHLKKSHDVSSSPDKEFQVLFKAVFGVSSLDEEGDFESGSEAECFWLQLWAKYGGRKCPVCPKEYSIYKKRDWTWHILSHHTSNRIACSQCKASFKTKKSAKTHEETVHSANGENFASPCAKCEKIFTGPSQSIAKTRLNNHTRRMHPDPTLPHPYLCQACGKGFPYKTQLAEHSLQHTDDRPFHCEQCPKDFKRKEDLRKHVKKVHEGFGRKKVTKSKMCSDCGEFFRPQQYKIHVLSHTGEKPFKCPECDGAFTSKDCLTQHMVFHQGKRQYLCDICKSSFFLKHHLTAHMKTHSDEKPFHCDICSLDFRLKHHLQAHRSRRHGIQSGTTRGPKAKVIAGLESKHTAESSA